MEKDKCDCLKQTHACKLDPQIFSQIYERIHEGPLYIRIQMKAFRTQGSKFLNLNAGAVPEKSPRPDSGHWVAVC